MNDYTAVDIETTGLRPKLDRIIEIGAIRVRDNEIESTFQTFVNPGRAIPDNIVELTGITRNDVINAPFIDSAIREFLSFVGKDILLGHNLLFDFSFLKTNAVNCGYTFEKMGIDTLKIARKIHPRLESRSLMNLAKYYEIEDQNHHRALNDAVLAHELYCRLRMESEDNEIFEPRQMIYKTKKQNPVTERQKTYLNDLLRYHRIETDVDMDQLTKNDASRMIDKIILQHGRIF